MEYEFSFGMFFVGFLIVLAGVIFMRFHQTIADNLGSGMASYDRFKLWALITCGLGLIVSVNLHWFILGNILIKLFPSFG